MVLNRSYKCLTFPKKRGHLVCRFETQIHFCFPDVQDAARADPAPGSANAGLSADVDCSGRERAGVPVNTSVLHIWQSALHCEFTQNCYKHILLLLPGYTCTFKMYYL